MVISRHRCPTCGNEADFTPVLDGKSKCFSCHAIVNTADLAALQHDEMAQPGDILSESVDDG